MEFPEGVRSIGKLRGGSYKLSAMNPFSESVRSIAKLCSGSKDGRDGVEVFGVVTVEARYVLCVCRQCGGRRAHMSMLPGRRDQDSQRGLPSIGTLSWPACLGVEMAWLSGLTGKKAAMSELDGEGNNDETYNELGK